MFFSSICVDPGPTNRGPTSLLALKIRTPVANTGKLRSIGQMPVSKTTKLPQVTDKLYHIMFYRVLLTWAWIELTFGCIGSCKSNYHMITTTTALLSFFILIINKLFDNTNMIIINFAKITTCTFGMEFTPFLTFCSNIYHNISFNFFSLFHISFFLSLTTCSCPLIHTILW